MELKIGNITAGLILILSLWIFIKMKPGIIDALIAVTKTGPGNAPEDQLKGCIALGLVILGLVSALRLILSERDKK